MKSINAFGKNYESGLQTHSEKVMCSMAEASRHNFLKGEKYENSWRPFLEMRQHSIVPYGKIF